MVETVDYYYVERTHLNRTSIQHGEKKQDDSVFMITTQETQKAIESVKRILEKYKGVVFIKKANPLN
jgi:hypothetical protein